MKITSKKRLLAAAAILAGGLSAAGARADETIKIGISAPLSGAGAIWGQTIEWLCNQAAKEIKASGGVKVKGTTYNYSCVAYDNKFSASEGTKVAQTLLNRDGAKYVYGFGTAAILAMQSLSERQGVMLMNTSWGMSSKGPKFPLTFQVNNTPVEIMPAVAKYLSTTFPQAKTVALLNVNDASGHEAESVYHPTYEKFGIKVITSDFYDRGTTEFQPVAQRLASFHPDIIDIGSASPAEAGAVYKLLDTIGYKGIRVMTNGTTAEAFLATVGTAGNGVYMGAAIDFGGKSITEHQRALNTAALAANGDSLGTPTISGYDMVYMLKAGMEKAQSIEPTEVAKVMPGVKYQSFYGSGVGFGGKDRYGSVMAPQLPVFITQVVDGKLVEKARIEASGD